MQFGYSILLVAFASFVLAWETYNRSNRLFSRVSFLRENQVLSSRDQLRLPVTQIWMLRKAKSRHAPASPRDISYTQRQRDFSDRINDRPWLISLLHASVIPVAIVVGFLLVVFINSIQVGFIELIAALSFVMFLLSSGFFELNEYFAQVAMNPYFDEKFTNVDHKYFVVVAYAFRARARVFLILTGFFLLVFALYDPLLWVLAAVIAFVQTTLFIGVIAPLIKTFGALGVLPLLFICFVFAQLLAKVSSLVWHFMTRLPEGVAMENLHLEMF